MTREEGIDRARPIGGARFRVRYTCTDRVVVVVARANRWLDAHADMHRAGVLFLRRVAGQYRAVTHLFTSDDEQRLARAAPLTRNNSSILTVTHRRRRRRPRARIQSPDNKLLVARARARAHAHSYPAATVSFSIGDDASRLDWKFRSGKRGSRKNCHDSNCDSDPSCIERNSCVFRSHIS